MSLINQTLQGRYLISHEIGEGGMGRVYYAEDIRLNQVVAIKEALSPSNESSQLIAARVKAFQREAHLLAGKVKHHAVPRVIDYFQIDANWYIVMDYVDGESLDQQLRQRGEPFSIKEVLLWTGQLLEILDSLHSGTPGIIHRDIKPSNIKVKNDKVCLLDFGLAKQLTSAKKSTVAMFTPAFAAPEQMENKEPTAKSDLYSVGATMYCLLSNTEPINASHRAIAIASGGTDPLLPIKELRTDLPDEIADLIMSALSIKPEERPHKADAMRARLECVLTETDKTFHRPSYEFLEATKTLTSSPSHPSPHHADNPEMKETRSGPIAKESPQQPTMASMFASLPLPHNKTVQSKTASPKNINGKWVIAGAALLLAIIAVGFVIGFRRNSPPPINFRQIAIEKTEQAMERLYVNDYEEAKALAKQAFETDPTYALAQAIHGDAFWDEDDTEMEDSSKTYQSQIGKAAILKFFNGKEPTSGEEYAARAWGFLADRKWWNAKKDIEQAIVKRPEWAWALMQKGFAVYGGGECPKEMGSAESLDAIRAFEKVNSLKPKYAMAYMNLASAYGCNHQNKEALAAYDRAVELRQSPKFYVRRGTFHLDSIEDNADEQGKQKNIESARKDFEKALEKDATHSKAHTGLARTHELKQEYKECISEADKALSSKDSFDGYYWRASCRGSLASKDKDEKALDEAIVDLERAKLELAKYSEQGNRESGWAFYYLAKSYLHESKATYLLTEQYLKKKNSDNGNKVMTELENAKSAVDKGLENNTNKNLDKIFKARKNVIETDIRKFKIFSRRSG